MEVKWNLVVPGSATRSCPYFFIFTLANIVVPVTVSAVPVSLVVPSAMLLPLFSGPSWQHFRTSNRTSNTRGTIVSIGSIDTTNTNGIVVLSVHLQVASWAETSAAQLCFGSTWISTTDWNFSLIDKILNYSKKNLHLNLL